MDTRAPTMRDPAHRVSPRARLMWLADAVVAALVTMGALWAVDRWAHHLPWWLLLAVGIVVVLNVGVVPQWRYAVHRWEATETAVYTQTGWWVRERRIAPMSRIQTVDYAEGAIARLFGLASVTVTTASAAGALEIAGLDRDRARQLVVELTAKADAVAGDAT